MIVFITFTSSINIQNKHPNECVAASADLSNNATPPVKWSQTDNQQIACTEDLCIYTITCIYNIQQLIIY